MSYLNPLRLHFKGSFQAAVPTVNNDPANFDSADYVPSDQSASDENQPSARANGFNPAGSGAWRLISCKVTSAFIADEAVRKPDPILGAIVADSDRMVAAKMVDLDPQQQSVSMIWGLEVRIATAEGDTMLRGTFEPVAFMDIWNRRLVLRNKPKDADIAAMYQSVLTDLDWNKKTLDSSPFLSGLKGAATDGLLSIKFNLDGINVHPQSDSFLMGRIVGTIGPADFGEPRHFVLGRQFMATAGNDIPIFTPDGEVNFCVAAVNQDTKRIYLDLGNALPTDDPGGRLKKIGDLELRCGPADSPKGPAIIGFLEEAEYTRAAEEPRGSWYEETAGIVVFPRPDDELSADTLAAISENPLTLVVKKLDGTRKLAIEEPTSGLFVRADQFVFRLDPGDSQLVCIHATRFGYTYPGAGVITFPVPDQLPAGDPSHGAPHVAVPPDAIDYPPRIVTDDHGVAKLHIRTRDPGRPRDYVDGQIYALYPVLEETIVSPTDPYPYNQSNYISLRVWSGFEPDEPPTWFGSIHPILRQYASLYPVMRDFFDLGDYKSVSKNRHLLIHALRLDLANPNYMPVTRDLSTAKRDAIVRWLSELGLGGIPREGVPRPPGAGVAQPGSADSPARQPGAASPAEPAQPVEPTQPTDREKTSAAGRRSAARRLSAKTRHAWLDPKGEQA